MEINVSQVGQDFALPRGSKELDVSRTKDSTNTDLATVKQETKDLLNSAEISKTELVSAEKVEIEIAVSRLSEFVQTNNRQLNFSVDEGSNKQVVRVTDAESGKVIRQIPSEEVLELSERLQDLQTEVGTAVGLLFNKQV